MKQYQYRPIRFYLTVFILTWSCWIAAALCRKNETAMTWMFLGLCVPAATAVLTVFLSGSKALKSDLKRKLVGFYRIHPVNLLSAFVLFVCIAAVSILLSVLFGQSLDQFSFAEGFSFSIKGSSALLTILLASVIEELGWRGYGEDAIAQYGSWFWESVLFGFIWSAWHIPLFFIEGTYQAGLLQLGTGYALNFFISVIPLGFLTTWVYVKNNRSMMASIFFHIVVNFFQEKIAMTPQTKCVETFVITLAAAGIVLANKEMFFETDHVGRLLEAKKN
ncbi:CPBP family intramembrane glutamic endopeptidase [Anaerostipes sp.]|uniref:CPBP family intramembrane glutamic endopeptidase n=1 Tax=Anaerostipes sp. TaxID=1872530 RepID=UPI0025C0ED18|nr:CPBP family intramembrane glutamic endopeptidase [Anaerostipes sp.]MBS7009745.1 CPBP family intramembrane metalloprotease [Anaerostipes sp.]